MCRNDLVSPCVLRNRLYSDVLRNALIDARTEGDSIFNCVINRCVINRNTMLVCRTGQCIEYTVVSENCVQQKFRDEIRERYNSMPASLHNPFPNEKCFPRIM